jgi:isocitrate lyase
MSQGTNIAVVKARLPNSEHRFSPNSCCDRSWQTAQDLIGLGALTAGLPSGVRISRLSGQKTQRVLEPTGHVLHRLEAARAAARMTDPEPVIFACTNAREALSLTSDEDARDRRYLSGIRNVEKFHVYCGGVEAAVHRALLFARLADVVCYRAATADLCGARQFASSVRAHFSAKPLGIGITLSGPEPLREFDSICEIRKLSKLGYDYCFFTLSGEVVFTSFPDAKPWAFFDDAPVPPDVSRPMRSAPTN